MRAVSRTEFGDTAGRSPALHLTMATLFLNMLQARQSRKQSLRIARGMATTHHWLRRRISFALSPKGKETMYSVPTTVTAFVTSIQPPAPEVTCFS